MTEREFDIELIMAIAEGTLSPTEAAAAERALDDAGLAELAAQRAALAALAEAPVPMLSAEERAAMRSAIRSEIHLDQPPAHSPEPVAAPWYARWMPALGGLALVIIVAGVGITSLGGGDDSATFSEIGAELSSRATPDDADQTALTEEAASAPMATVAAAADEAADGADAGGAADTAEAEMAATTLAPPTEFTRQLSAIDLGSLDSDDPAGVLAATSDAIEEARSAFPYDALALPAAATSIDQSCWTELLDEFDQASVLLTANATIDGDDGEVYVLDGGDGPLVYLYQVTGCALIDELELER